MKHPLNILMQEEVVIFFKNHNPTALIITIKEVLLSYLASKVTTNCPVEIAENVQGILELCDLLETGAQNIEEIKE